jgi:hypothetical protein
MTRGEEFIERVHERYALSPHEQELIEQAGAALDRHNVADTEFKRHIEATNTVLIAGGKAHPASVVARDSAKLFELLCRSAHLPEDVIEDASVPRLRRVANGSH